MTITNFGVVTPGALCRGAQPTAEQFAELKAIGVTDVIDLREPWGREVETAACMANGIIHTNIPVGFGPLSFGVEPPTDGEIRNILAVIGVPGRISFVHCERGQDRTGAVIAAYRISVDGWTNRQALDEAIAFHISPFQFVIREWIEHYQCSLSKSSLA